MLALSPLPWPKSRSDPANSDEKSNLLKTLKLSQSSPRSVAAVWFAGAAGITALPLCTLMAVSNPSERHMAVLFTVSAMLTGAFWGTLIGKPCADPRQSCSLIRSMMIGAVGALLSMATFGLPVCVLIFAWSATYNLGLWQPFELEGFLKSLLLFSRAALLVGSWFTIPTGAIAAILLSKLQSTVSMVGQSLRPVESGSSFTPFDDRPPSKQYIELPYRSLSNPSVTDQEPISCFGHRDPGE